MSDTLTVPTMVSWLRHFRDAVTEQQDYLTGLDAAIGDADHGANLVRGMNAVMDKLGDAPAGPLDQLGKTVGMTLVSSVGGASGPLYGTFFLRLGTAAGAVGELDGPSLGSALRVGLEGVIARGKAELGDKTMVDALTPALDAYDSAINAGGGLRAASAAAAEAAAKGRDATEPLVAHKGRASYLGERSAGHIDPGSASVTLLLESLATAAAES